jgi:lipid-binding SYLF domain-containing protein
MKRLLVVSAVLLAAASARAEDVWERLYSCHLVLDDILEMPDAIPSGLLDKAECVAIIPSVKKAALGIGGSYGKGALVCRGTREYSGPWGAPAMVRLEGGSIGFQLGGQATDYILLVMNRRGVEGILNTSVKLGADASVAAGPKGRTALAATDASFKAEILSYSRNKGLFAGVSLEGSTLRSDKGANRELYGEELNTRQVVSVPDRPVPTAAERLVQLLRTVSPTNLSDDAGKPAEGQP